SMPLHPSMVKILVCTSAQLARPDRIHAFMILLQRHGGTKFFFVFLCVRGWTRRQQGRVLSYDSTEGGGCLTMNQLRFIKGFLSMPLHPLIMKILVCNSTQLATRETVWTLLYFGHKGTEALSCLSALVEAFRASSCPAIDLPNSI